MKTFLPTTPLLASVFLLIAACNKNDDKAPIDQLPPATQTGAGTAGCLINGKAFLPKGSGLGGPVLSAFYQFIDGEYYFGLGISNKTNDVLKYIDISTNAIQLNQGQNYKLSNYETDNTLAKYIINFPPGYETNNEITGELTITRLDPMQSIVSGTFWFDAINEAGETVEVREGRFDLHYVN